jgi:hypothetical protein
MRFLVTTAGLHRTHRTHEVCLYTSTSREWLTQLRSVANYKSVELETVDTSGDQLNRNRLCTLCLIFTPSSVYVSVQRNYRKGHAVLGCRV